MAPGKPAQLAHHAYSTVAGGMFNFNLAQTQHKIQPVHQRPWQSTCFDPVGSSFVLEEER